MATRVGARTATWLAAFVIVALASFEARTASADEVDALARARTLMMGFEYADAAAALEDFITSRPDPADELAARALLVEAFASAGHEDRARDAATELYARDPGYALRYSDRIAPRIRSFYIDAQREAESHPPAVLRIRLRRAGDVLRARLSATTDAIVARATMGARSADANEFEEVPLEGSGPVRTGVIEAEPEGTIEYYARYEAPSGHVVAEAGSEDTPMVHQLDDLSADPVGSTGPAVETDDDSTATWLLVGGGAALLIGAVVAFFVVDPFGTDPSLDREIELP